MKQVVLVGYLIAVALVFVAMVIATVVLVAAAVLTPDREMAGRYGAAALVTFLVTLLAFTILAAPRRTILLRGPALTALHHHEDGTAYSMLVIDGQRMNGGSPGGTERADFIAWKFRCIAHDHTIVTVTVGPTRLER